MTRFDRLIQELREQTGISEDVKIDEILRAFRGADTENEAMQALGVDTSDWSDLPDCPRCADGDMIQVETGGWQCERRACLHTAPVGAFGREA